MAVLAIGTMQESVLWKRFNGKRTLSILVKTIQHIATNNPQSRYIWWCNCPCEPRSVTSCIFVLDANLIYLSKAGESWVKAVDFYWTFQWRFGSRRTVEKLFATHGTRREAVQQVSARKALDRQCLCTWIGCIDKWRSTGDYSASWISAVS